MPRASAARAEMANVRLVVNAIRDRARSLRVGGRDRRTVGYSAPYAIYVHENLEAHHDNGQAKYLEQPARTERDTMAEIIRREMKAGRTLGQANEKAGQHLLRESKKLVPVLTGALKNSGFYRIG